MNERRSARQPINTWQGIISHWRREMVPPEKNTPQREFSRSLQEVDELRAEVESHDGSVDSSLKVGLEAVDVMISMMSIVDSLGLDTERLMAIKAEQLYRKYNIQVNRELQQQGMTWDEAIAQQKRLYDTPPPQSSFDEIRLANLRKHKMIPDPIANPFADRRYRMPNQFSEKIVPVVGEQPVFQRSEIFPYETGEGDKTTGK